MGGVLVDVSDATECECDRSSHRLISGPAPHWRMRLFGGPPEPTAPNPDFPKTQESVLILKPRTDRCHPPRRDDRPLLDTGRGHYAAFEASTPFRATIRSPIDDGIRSACEAPGFGALRCSHWEIASDLGQFVQSVRVQVSNGLETRKTPGSSGAFLVLLRRHA